MKTISTALTLVVCLAAVSATSAFDRTLYNFNAPLSVGQFRTVNDGVMGGRSDGRIKINAYKNLEFYGNLSLENNGGFASFRSGESNLGLRAGDAILLKVRGDGREYNFNLYSSGRRTFRKSFKTVDGEWLVVRLPIDQFVATFRGRTMRNVSMEPAQLNRLGIQLGDKKPGPFKLEVEWIKSSGGQVSGR
ncbi:MAG: CIA30 family protein [Mariniblastus sp.]|nr:CIA30 family protein [Mariniblastus sp.]